MTSTVADLVQARADDTRTGLVFEDRTWTWAEVVEEAQGRASALHEGAHYGVLLDNVPEYVFLLAGAALSRAVIVGLNPTRRGGELARDVRHTDCVAVITATPERFEDQDLGGAEVLGRLAPGRAPTHVPRPDDLFVLIFTSGSTGPPKAVKVSHGRAARTAAAFPHRADDVLYGAMPLFHGNAIFSSLLPGFATGCRVVLRRRFSASAFLDDIRAHRCTFFNSVGRAIAYINATPPTDHDRDHHLKWVLGPETSDADKAAFSARFGVPIIEGYGSSENAVVLLPAPPGARAGALGVAEAGTDVAVVDPETGDECPRARFDEHGTLANADQAIGELVGRNTADRFEGYYNDPEAEATRLRRGWYWTGDLAYRDDDGIFYFAGRNGDWLRVDSENFTAAPIERILTRAPEVSGAAVYPVPDPRTGDQVMAALELKPGASFDPDAFTEFLAAQSDLGPKWVPTFVRIVESLPVTATAKLDKRPLRTAGWHTDDPLWWRPRRDGRFVPFTARDVASLDTALADHGRSNLLPQ